MYYLSEVVMLRTVNWFVGNLLSYVVFAAIVLFQADLRRVLSRLGRASLFRHFTRRGTTDEMVEEVVTAAGMLAERRVGALIAIERDIGLRTYVDSGIYLDARVTYDLLVSVFQPESPLHDGAVVIQENRLAAASCFLPLTVNVQSTHLGTRHRAAIGLTEESDAVALIVSEETGAVSLVVDGEIESGLDSKLLTNRLDSAMHTRRSRRRSSAQKAV
jgi:diadenylate cyclase